ncbi:MAG: ATP synthase F0 subunit C [Desulfovibrio sp.]|uniref:ATP synthase subunit c n=1 Tax=Megalodesulfovibrio gigas (strain ATCC 19364 / DSM 1382 / NCIMB 9332 / VKM B-1759) TaxID=1121448 RepID=T2GAY4_MEGG1|nr:ATP synthase F0 subunit C [Megalodesulfovibrio gigas]AGW13344.1 putative ATP synthase F0, C subunit [Megalodesulfovibrio gigas DSM 1382 = ATCC 19364]MCA1946365.1 ATP synthase F0 subunit C [Desulfovibrio sp.]MCA1987374.1 ATP synthase F0 subunit C [Desulfovibrio sp.]
MRKSLMIVLNTLAMLSLAAVAFAADGGVKLDAPALGLTLFAAGIGMAIAAAGCGIGQGMGLKAALEGTARNPDAGGKIMTSLILGLAFVESLAIYALVINILLIMANPYV